jgi:cyclophilin family peptidyl-prolyl cis-trans isomerase
MIAIAQLPRTTRLLRLALPVLLVLVLLLAPRLNAQSTAGPSPEVVIDTSEGRIVLRLYPDEAPRTVENFLSYVDEAFYDGTIFHRVIQNFMIQGCGFLPDLTEKPTGEPIPNESRNRIHNVRGTVAMARTEDPDSATAQFFINQRTNLQLDWTPGKEGYTVFGEVVEGMSVVDFIASAPVMQVGRMQDVPETPILINSIRRKSLLD